MTINVQVAGWSLFGAVVLAGHAGAWFHGYRQAQQAAAAEMARQATESARYALLWRERHFELSTAFEALRAARTAARREIVREIEKVVERPVYRDCRADDDAVRLLNAARGIELPITAGEPDASLPDAGAGH